MDEIKDPRDKFELSDIFRPLEESDGLIFKHMFGGLAVYSEGLMKFVLTEDEGNFEWKGQIYDFPVWHGLMICTDRAHHQSLMDEFPGIVTHPILPKWLVLPFLDEQAFRKRAKKLIHAALKGDDRIGIVPKAKKKKTTKKKATRKKKKR